MLIPMPVAPHSNSDMSSAYVIAAVTDQSASGSSSEWSSSSAEILRAVRQGLDQMQDQLLDWYMDPLSLGDGDVEPPSRLAISRALQLTNRLKQASNSVEAILLLPRGASIGSGGAISLEFEGGPVAVTFRCEPNGQTYRMVFVQDRLVRQEPLTI